ncbi:hypothetical protein WJX73_010322 [Symbiochloris irregularis]|uniref:Magnesium transporter n=1 Tax=Symbiochloris irregularis TaxID=706552 RepID=A0AAW1NWS1_9CHLO
MPDTHIHGAYRFSKKAKAGTCKGLQQCRSTSFAFTNKTDQRLGSRLATGSAILTSGDSLRQTNPGELSPAELQSLFGREQVKQEALAVPNLSGLDNNDVASNFMRILAAWLGTSLAPDGSSFDCTAGRVHHKLRERIFRSLATTNPDMAVFEHGAPQTAQFVAMVFEFQQGAIDDDHRGRMIEWLKALLAEHPLRPEAYGVIMSPTETVIMEGTGGQQRFDVRQTGVLDTATSGLGWSCRMLASDPGALGQRTLHLAVEGNWRPLYALGSGRKNVVYAVVHADDAESTECAAKVFIGDYRYHTVQHEVRVLSDLRRQGLSGAGNIPTLVANSGKTVAFTWCPFAIITEPVITEIEYGHMGIDSRGEGHLIDLGEARQIGQGASWGVYGSIGYMDDSCLEALARGDARPPNMFDQVGYDLVGLVKSFAAIRFNLRPTVEAKRGEPDLKKRAQDLVALWQEVSRAEGSVPELFRAAIAAAQNGATKCKSTDARWTTRPRSYGSSFIVKKKGLRLAASTGLRAGGGGYSYLLQPLWWAGLLTMFLGEVANFAAYAFAPAILVTPLGALSIIVSAVLAHWMLNERLNIFGMLGCMLCITGSLTIVLHAPEERPIASLVQIWLMAMQPGFLLYVVIIIAVSGYLMVWAAPLHGTTNVFIYVGICSLVGSLTVMSVKALGIGLKLTFQGNNQFWYPEFYYCIVVVGVCVVIQMNYLNKALDLFNTAIVSPIYYVMFTVCTITASVILFQEEQTTTQIITEGAGFVTIVIGTTLLHTTRDLDVSLAQFSQLVQAAQPSGANLAQARGGSSARYSELPLSRMPSSSAGVMSPNATGIAAVGGNVARSRTVDMS